MSTGAEAPIGPQLTAVGRISWRSMSGQRSRKFLNDRRPPPMCWRFECRGSTAGSAPLQSWHHGPFVGPDPDNSWQPLGSKHISSHCRRIDTWSSQDVSPIAVLTTNTFLVHSGFSSSLIMVRWYVSQRNPVALTEKVQMFSSHSSIGFGVKKRAAKVLV